jgi:hypothetical protein
MRVVTGALLFTLVSLTSTTAQYQTKVPSAEPSVQVYKSASCGCCAKWVEHLRAAGFKVTATDVPDVAAIRAKYNVPSNVAGCHTAIVDSYIVEGHVPAEDVKLLLAKRPAVAGIAAPGMPLGSPGMESPNAKPYDVVSFDKQGKTAVFATHGGDSGSR